MSCFCVDNPIVIPLQAINILTWANKKHWLQTIFQQQCHVPICFAVTCQDTTFSLVFFVLTQFKVPKQYVTAHYSAGFCSLLIHLTKIILIYIQTVIKHEHDFHCDALNAELNMDTIMEVNQTDSLNKLCKNMVPARGRHIIYFTHLLRFSCRTLMQIRRDKKEEKMTKNNGHLTCV